MKKETNNYRPIALVPVLLQIVEKIVVRQLLYHHLEKNNLIIKTPFGFREGYGAVVAACKLVEEIKQSYENKEKCIVNFCDLSKDFDMVSHEILLSKLEKYGIKGTALNFFFRLVSQVSQEVTNCTLYLRRHLS